MFWLQLQQNLVNLVSKEVIAMIESFNTLFVDVKKQREQMNKVMTVLRDFKEEAERLTD